jgi:NTE family protein
VCALLAWYALLEHGKNETGAAEAARSLEKFWLEDNAARETSERLLNDWLVGFLRWQQATGLLVESSPNAFSDYWQNRLRLILEDNIPFGKITGELVKPSSPMLFVGAVDVLTGEFKVFGSHRERRDGSAGPASSWVFNDDPESGIGVDAVLASAAIPPIFRSVRVGQSVYWDGLFSQNPPVRELFDARPDEVWVIQINPNRMAPRPRDPVPDDEPTSVVDIIDRRNELSGNLSLNQELRYVEKINELVVELGEEEASGGKRLRLGGGKEYRPVVVRQIEMSRPLSAASKLDRSPTFIREMMGYGERRADEFFRALAFEEAWASGDPDTISRFFAEDAEVRLEAPLFRDRASYKGEREVLGFVREHLAKDGVRVDLTKKEVVGEAVTWTVRISPRLSGEAADGRAEAVFERGKVRSLTIVPSNVKNGARALHR